jgi:hypothetical protein
MYISRTSRLSLIQMIRKDSNLRIKESILTFELHKDTPSNKSAPKTCSNPSKTQPCIPPSSTAHTPNSGN